MPVLAINDRVVRHPPSSAVHFLKQYPRGPYSSLTIQPGQRVQCWKEHCNRLSQSLSILADTGIYQDWLQLRDTGAIAPDAIGRIVARTLSVALDASEKLTGPERDTAAVVLLNPAGSHGRTTANAVDVLVHTSPFIWPAASLETPVEVALLSTGQRLLPAAKDSSWATTRLPLEAAVPCTAVEGILCSPSGQLLEGLVTNIFVIKGSREKAVVQTASVADGILDGIVRRKVLEVCQNSGIQVLEEAPNTTESHQWREAFLTNCRRLVQPIRQMVHASVQDPPLWTCATHTGAGPLTCHLQAALLTLLSAESDAI